MATVVLEKLEKTFEARKGAGTPVVRGIDLSVADGEFLALVGPSGCGKSTTLRLIAGLEEVSAGRILIDGQRVDQLPPKERDIAMVFQSYALYPHLSVRDNLAFGLKLRGHPKAEIETRVGEAAELLELTPYLGRKPRELSGGQRQRVAVGRAIVRKPKVFLFDEPLSNLDASMRASMRAELKALHRRLGSTMIYVTHDQVEAMTMADRICLLKDGRIQQVATPLELYQRPATRFAASFIGSPPMNFLEGRLEIEAGLGTLSLASPDKQARLQLPWTSATQPRLAALSGGPVVLGVRPEQVRLQPSGALHPTHSVPGDTLLLESALESVDPLGAETLVTVSTPFGRLVVKVPGYFSAPDKAFLQVQAAPSDFAFFDAETGARV